MNDENKNNPDLHDEEHEHDDFEDTFDDAFGIDEAPELDPLTPEEIEAHEKAPDETSIERPAKKNGSLVPFVVGVAVVGFLGWKLYGSFFEKPKNTTAQSTATPTQKIAVPPPTDMTEIPSYDNAPVPSNALPKAPEVTEEKPSQPSAPPVVLPEKKSSEITSIPTSGLTATADATAQATKDAHADLTKLQTKLEEQDKAYKQKIDALEKEMATTKQNTADIARSLGNIQQDIKTLSTVVQQLSGQVGLFQQDQERQEIRREQAATRSKAKKAKSHNHAEQLPSLTVYAIIPGRAWLRSANGKTITVSEGDNIGEYGKVLKIDASSGVVITTSGVTLR